MGSENGGENNTTLKSVASTVALPIEGMLSWGELHLHPHLSYQLLYGIGVPFAPGKKANTLTQTFSPGVSMALGPHWTFDYTPSFRFFSDRNFRDTLDHSLALNGNTSFGNWSYSLFQSYTASDEPLVETGSQTEQQSYSAGFSASYHFSTKWSESTSVTATLHFLGQSSGAPQALTDTRDYSVAQTLDYHISVPLSVGVGASMGTSDQATGFNSVNEQFFGRVNWIPGQKLSVSLNAGIQDQQFLDSSSRSSDLSPIFGASISYHIFEPTTFTLSASRSIGASLYKNQNSDNIQVDASLQQRLLHRLSFSVDFGYSTTDYTDTTANGPTLRSDQNYTLNVALNTAFLKHGSISTFYQYGLGSSSVSLFQYTSNQVGATVTWSF